MSRIPEPPARDSSRSGLRSNKERADEEEVRSLFRVGTRPFLSLTFSAVATSAISFVSTVILARVLRLDEFGHLVFAQAAVGSVFAFLDPRIEDAVIRFVPLVERRYGGPVCSALFKRALIVDQSIGMLFAVLISAFVAIPALAFPSIVQRDFVLLVLVQAGLQASLGTAYAGFSVTDGLAKLGLLKLAVTALSSLASIGALLLGGPIAYLSTSAVAVASSTLILGRTALRRVEKRFGRPTRIPSGTLSNVLPFTLKASLGSSVAIGVDSLPTSLLGLVSNARVVGLFRVGMAPARMTGAFMSSWASIMFPILSRRAAAGDVDTARRQLLGFTAITAPVLLLGGAIAWISMPVLVDLLFGASFRSVVPAAQLLTLAALVRSSVVWAKVAPLALGRPGLRVVFTAVDGGLLAFATLYLAPRGLTSVGWGHLAVAVMSCLGWILVVLRITRLPSKSESRP